MVEPSFPNFRVNRDGTFNNLAVDGINLPSSVFSNEGKLLVASRNISQAQSIKLTFPVPDYTFSGTGLQDIFTGLIYSTISDILFTILL